MARKRQRKPGAAAYLIAAAITYAKTSSQNRLDNARENLMKAQTRDRKAATLERQMRIAVMDEQRKLIAARRKMLENPRNNNALNSGLVTGDTCPNCGLIHVPQLNASNCSDCGTPLNPLLLME
jgi:hypothetical protein